MKLKNLVRSPHIIEVLFAYGGVHLISIYLLFSRFNGGLTEYLYGLALGGFIYTFIEYWFHRYLLHVSFLKKAHDNHHARPTKLKIIATPLLPVQVYECLVMVLIAYFFGSYLANLAQIGISISQVIMDYVHFFEHSAYQPWFLASARSYHKLHHRKSNHDFGFGLTCPFWDFVFDTLPNKKNQEKHQLVAWEPFTKYSFLEYIQIPLPMITFLLWTPFVKKNKNTSSNMKWPTWDNLYLSNLVIASLSALVVGFSPLLF